MTFAPQSLLDLQALWEKEGGVGLGIVGDTRHIASGSGYHLGRDHLRPGDYSARLPRDVAGLSLAASAIDLGKLHGSLFFLQAFSRWLVKRIQDHPDLYRDVREVIYSPDGIHVYRYDNAGRHLYLGGSGTGQGDDTHLWHTHISVYRDAEHRDHRSWFAPYFTAGSPVPTPTPEADMPGVAFDLDVTHDVNPWDALGTAVVTGAGHDLIRVRDNVAAVLNVANGLNLGVVATAKIVAPAPHWAAVGEAIVVYNFAGQLHCSPRRDVTFKPLPPPADLTPYAQAALDAAKAAGFADARTKAIAAVTAI